ncbi:cysteine protease ATG4B-like [Corticium candelabrum]|uniref:cysteine protease ATG4B-like n=1 Tax=Corticium candelabrum TaxID=121492 RepID=UPI002E268B05|nr:cysteine protease ATG4B-like [Corticium candelabrum]
MTELELTDAPFAAFVTYENVSETGDQLDSIAEKGPIWILGECLELDGEREKKLLKEIIYSKLWFTYRKNFRAIGGTGYTSDAGWGCTLRCGQMMLAQALTWRHLGRDWKWTSNTHNPVYNQLLGEFLDCPESLYSIQQIAQCGVDFNRAVGQWFGPNNMCHVIRKLAEFDHWSSLAVFVAMDMTVVFSEIKQVCRERRTQIESGPPSPAAAAAAASASQPSFKPLLLFIPLRPGQDKIREEYREAVKTCLKVKQSIGIIGGKPKHAFWFFGCQGNQLLYLDPHTTHMSVNPEMKSNIPDKSYHCSSINFLPISDLDPSISLGFYCHDEEEVDQLYHQLVSTVVGYKQPLFEVFDRRPRNIPPLQDPRPQRRNLPEESFTELVVNADVGSDTDEEYDIIDCRELSDMV